MLDVAVTRTIDWEKSNEYPNFTQYLQGGTSMLWERLTT